MAWFASEPLLRSSLTTLTWLFLLARCNAVNPFCGEKVGEVEELGKAGMVK